MSSPFCPVCGSPSPPEARFCMGCGRERHAGQPPTAQMTVTVPVAAPQAPRPSVGKWVGAAVAAFAVGGMVAGAIVVFGGSKDDGANGRAARPDTSPSATASASATVAPHPTPSVAATGPAAAPSAAATAGSGRLPAGYVMKRDPRGFALGVLNGWQREAKGTQTDYRDPADGESYLRIGLIPNAGKTSYENFTTLEAGAAKRQDYQRLALTENTFRERPGAYWEFTYTNDAGRSIHAIDQAYVAPDGTEYSLYYECRTEEWDASQDQVFATALDTWTEPGTP